LIFDFEISETNNRKKQKNKNIITGYSVLDTNKKGFSIVIDIGKEQRKYLK